MLALQEFLKQLNWTEYESKLYCAIVENGPMKANDLAIKASIPAGRIYEIIKRLRDRGWLKRTQSRPAIYDAQNPRTVLQVAMDQLRTEMKDPLEKAEEAWEMRQGRIGDADDKSWTVSGIYGIILEFRDLCGGIKKSLKVADPSLQWLSARDFERFKSLIDNGAEISVVSTDLHKDKLTKLAHIGVNAFIFRNTDVSFSVFDEETVMLRFTSPDNGTVVKDKNLGKMFIMKFDDLIKDSEMLRIDQIVG